METLYFETSTRPSTMFIIVVVCLFLVALKVAGKLLGGFQGVGLLKILGVAAIVFFLVKFRGPQYVYLPGPFVQDRAQMAYDPTAAQPKQATRPSRPERPAKSVSANESLPPRSGEIPVTAELAQAVAPPAIPADVPAPAAVPLTPAAPAPAVADPPGEPIAPPATPPAEASLAPQPADAVAPPQASGPRPAWVDAPAKLANGVYAMPVSSGLYVSVPECQRELDHEIKREADYYIDEYLGEHASTLVDVSLAYLKQHIKKAEYSELIASESVGPMHQIHALLEFDDHARADFHRRWHDAIVTDRLWVVGSGAGWVLALLGTFYGYLKLDLRTGGACKGRLRLAATLVVLIVAVGTLLMRWAVPF